MSERVNQQQSEHRVGERASNGQRTSTEQANLDPTSYNAAPGTRAGRIAGEHLPFAAASTFAKAT